MLKDIFLGEINFFSISKLNLKFIIIFEVNYYILNYIVLHYLLNIQLKIVFVYIYL